MAFSMCIFLHFFPLMMAGWNSSSHRRITYVIFVRFFFSFEYKTKRCIFLCLFFNNKKPNAKTEMCCKGKINKIFYYNFFPLLNKMIERPAITHIMQYTYNSFAIFFLVISLGFYCCNSQGFVIHKNDNP